MAHGAIRATGASLALCAAGLCRRVAAYALHGSAAIATQYARAHGYCCAIRRACGRYAPIATQVEALSASVRALASPSHS